MPVYTEQDKVYLVSVLCWLQVTDIVLSAPCGTGQMLITVL